MTFCKDCKYAVSVESSWLREDYVDLYGEEGLWRIDRLECTLAETKDGQQCKPGKAHALDGEYYYGLLKVEPDFGCVQGETRKALDA